MSRRPCGSGSGLVDWNVPILRRNHDLTYVRRQASLPSVVSAAAANVMPGPKRFPSADLESVLERNMGVRQQDGSRASSGTASRRGGHRWDRHLQGRPFRNGAFPVKHDFQRTTVPIRFFVHKPQRLRRVVYLRLTLEWRFYREGKLYLPDSKTGPRTVWLCAAARDVLTRLPRSSRWVFPVGDLRTPWNWLDPFWQHVRKEAGLELWPEVGDGVKG